MCARFSNVIEFATSSYAICLASWLGVAGRLLRDTIPTPITLAAAPALEKLVAAAAFLISVTFTKLSHPGSCA